jgi:ParB-like chromosome segregation protein Spo0J
MKDRVKEFKRIPANELIPNEKNWRRHPREQVQTFQELVDEVGFADVVIVREVEGGYELIDGHMRTGMLLDETLPAIVVDLTDEEADTILMSLDPLGAMAKTNDERLQELVADIDEDLRERLKDLPVYKAEDVERATGPQPSRNPLVCPECGHEYGS